MPATPPTPATFFADKPRINTLRLSFVTVPPETITQAVAALGRVLHDAL